MIILYYVVHKNHLNEIELCGRFDNWKHFLRFQIVESHRGWIVTRYKILKEV